MIQYSPKNFSSLLGMPGFSDSLLKNHFTLYEGYVKNTNAILEKLFTLQTGTPEFNELSRRFGWEFNGMRLHELYFGNMSKDKKTMGQETALYKKIIESFNSADKYQENFKITGTLRGVGWVVMYYDKKFDCLFNVWIDDHATNHLISCKPILVMDMWEHAFMIDYGLKKTDYIDAFVANIDWNEAESRLAECV